MARVAVVTDSTSYLSKETIEKYGIYVVPLTVNFGLESYREGFDLSAEAFYEQLKAVKDLPTTSQPAIGEFVELYEKLAREYDAAIAIHLSSGISGTYNTSLTAANMVDGIEVAVIDSEISCYPLGFMAIEAAEMANAGKSLAEIKERIEWLVKNMRGYFIVDDLSHLHRGGRLNTAELIVGSMLKIKPIIHFNDKKLKPFEKIRTKKKALDRIFQLLDKDVKEASLIKCTIVQANVREEAEEIMEMIHKRYPNVEANISTLGPVIGTHVGEGMIGIGWYKKH
ncbi:fatty acid-binding protein DegV [Vulcanibacillus modesticaldus]|uniref:Fatty acid-binding protein DegV n=1 Tax=Vulcanibacillus modesticaldus TaxID=337097 RepID=A0A1D2YUX1_9BACI|nr:DegV family protein [Vulcanibacillus modesticaldus]OEF99508.1 fatty acid-binding protein DegV [Vulcanibacillus modesticaldus]